ncbi:hypothetical protein Tco_0816529 [Tanacetum coccineum]
MGLESSPQKSSGQSIEEEHVLLTSDKEILQIDISLGSRKEILVSPTPRKDSTKNLLYLKKGSSGSEKIVLSLHKFLAIIFNDDDIEERTSRWVNKCVKKFNPYARYGVEKHRMFSIIYEPVYGIIYKNSKKEKSVMRHSEIHKFCDATLNRVLEGLKSYNNDMKYGYVQRELINDEVE